MKRTAVVIGSGPNGLAAAIVLAQAGLSVELHEAAPEVGGATRSGELTLPGFVHDLGSAVHPMGISSPFFIKLRLEEHGLKWILPEASVAHPLDDGTAVTLERDVQATASQFGAAGSNYREVFDPLTNDWPTLVREVLRPLRLPLHPLLVARFGLRGIQPAKMFCRRTLVSPRASALFAGMAAHSVLRMEAPLSAAFGLIMGAAGHAVGWPIPRGGSRSIAAALTAVFEAAGGRIVTNSRIDDLKQVSGRDLVLCDVTPRQFVSMAGSYLPAPFRESLEQYRYGPGVFKMDWALSEPIPWRARECLRSATVHLGGTLEEIAASETAAWDGEPPKRPFVLVVQPTVFDPTRAPAGQHTAWAYCHVPNGWTGSAVAQIEGQIERFAPGFRDCILARATHNTKQMEAWNANLVGGDIVGGVFDLVQMPLRPTWRQYGTPLPGVYLCSSSTPPGGSVHGLCGYYAARRALGSGKSARI